MALVELRDISLIYHSRDGETEAIKDVNLGIDEKEFVAIVGPSGSGKTTLLKITAGLIAPSGGRIIKSDDVKIAYMPQRDGLFEWRSVIRNVLLQPEIAGTNMKLAREYGILYVIAKPHGRDGPTVDVISTERYAAKLNALYQSMGYPLPEKETGREETAKKAGPRSAPGRRSSLLRFLRHLHLHLCHSSLFRSGLVCC